MASTMDSSSSFLHIVECPVCLLKYDLPDRVPKILGCGHTFCLCCLRELGSGGHIQCPTCRAQYNMPVDGKVEDLISNHGIIALLESVCPNCKDHQKTEKCLHCDITLCPSCCQEHLTTWTADIKQTFSTLQTNVDGVTMTPEVTKSLIQSVQDEFHDLRKEITRTTAERIQQQLQLNDQQLCSIDKTQQTKINEILTQSAANHEAVKNWKDRMNRISELLDGGELTSKILANVACDIEEITGYLKSTDHNSVTDIDVIAIDGTKGVPLPHVEIASDIGYANGHSSPTSGRIDNTTDKNTCIPPTLIAGVVRYISSTLRYYKNLSHSTYILSGMSHDGVKGKYMHMAVSPVDGTIYVVDIGDKKTQTGNVVHFSDSGRHISCFETRKSPRGLSIDTNDNIVVTSDKHTIQYFELNGTLCDEQGSTGNSTGCFACPYGVAHGPSNELYVADANNMRVQVKKPGGEWSVHSVYNGTPAGVTVCPDGTLLVCTRDKKPELWKIDKDGSKTKITITDDGIIRDNNFGFAQMAIDKDGLILLLDCGNHSILVVDMKGQLHCKIGENGSLPGQFNYPSGICLTRDGRIVVSEIGNQRIQIF